MSIRIPIENKNYPKLLPTEPEKRSEMLRKYGGDTVRFPHIVERYEGLSREHYYTLAREALCNLCKEADSEKDSSKIEELRGRITHLKRVVFETKLARYENLDPEVYGNWSFPKVVPPEGNPRREYVLEDYNRDPEKHSRLTEEFEGLTLEGYKDHLGCIGIDIKQALEKDLYPEERRFLEARLQLINSKLNDAKEDRFNNPEKECGDWVFPLVLPPLGTPERDEMLEKFGKDTKLYPDLERLEGLSPKKYRELIRAQISEIHSEVIKMRGDDWVKVLTGREKVLTDREKVLVNRASVLGKKLMFFPDYGDSAYERKPSPPKIKEKSYEQKREEERITDQYLALICGYGGALLYQMDFQCQQRNS